MSFQMLKSLSIVIPAYNEEHQLATCLDAIAAQTAMPDEVIVVDNNSSDKTAEVALKYSFVTFLGEKKQGIVFTRNHGFVAVHSDIISRIDADTLLPPNWVERIQQFYADPANERLVFTSGAYFYNLRSGQFTGRMYSLIVHHINRLLLGHYFPWGSNTALPRAAWRKVRGDVCLRNDIHEDLDLGVHLERAGFHTVYKPGLRVGAVARRILNERGELWSYLAMWPRTFRIHDARKWVLIWPVVVGVWLGSYGIFLSEKLLSLFIRPKHIN
jgi:glycosyltransferase involved in cell wall biosynthesis